MSMEEFEKNENIEETAADNEVVTDEAVDVKEKKEKTNWIKELRDWVLAILVAVVVAFLVREYVFTLVKVQGASMEPSLHIND